MKSYIVTCTYTSDGGGTIQQYMIGEDYEEGTPEYEAEKTRLTAEAQIGYDNYDKGE